MNDILGYIELQEVHMVVLDGRKVRGLSVPDINVLETSRRIRYYMEKAWLKPMDIQQYLGLTCVQTVYRWLSGRALPSVDNLYALSQLFGVRIDDMLVGGRRVALARDGRFAKRVNIYCQCLCDMRKHY